MKKATVNNPRTKTRRRPSNSKWRQISYTFGIRSGEKGSDQYDQAICFEIAAQVASALGHKMRLRFDDPKIPVMIILEARL